MDCFVTYYKKKRPDTVGGVSVKFGVANTGNRAVEGVWVCFSAYTADGTAAKCEVRKRSTASIDIGCTIAPGEQRRNLLLDTGWYNKDIAEVRLESLEITYPDGTKEVANGHAATALPEDFVKREKMRRLRLYFIIIIAALAVIMAAAWLVWLQK